jgi:hypothetical protein
VKVIVVETTALSAAERITLFLMHSNLASNALESDPSSALSGTQPPALESGLEDAPEPLGDFDATAQRALIAGGSRVR